MSITRLWQSGFELQTMDEFNGYSGASISNEQAKSDTYSLQMGTTGYAYIDVGATAQMRVAMHIYHAGALSSDDADIVTFRSGENTVLQLRYHEATAKIEVWDNIDELADEDCGDFGVEGTWNHLSIDFKLDGASGWVSVRLNGAEIINFSGDTNDGGTTVDEVRFGFLSNPWENYIYYDDVYVDDTTGEGAATTPPDYRYHLITPNGTGAANQWDGSDGDNSDNYLLLDDIPCDKETSYIASDTDGEKDYQSMTTYALQNGESFVSVIGYAYVRKEDNASTASVKLNMHDGSNEDASGLKTVTTSYSLISERNVLAPDGGAWDQAAINGLQIGVEINV